MNYLIDKCVLFLISFIMYVNDVQEFYMIIPILIIIMLSTLMSYKDEDLVFLTVLIIYFILCIVEPAFIFFIPLISYDIFFCKFKVLWFVLLYPLMKVAVLTNVFTFSLMIGFISLSYLLRWRTEAYEAIKRNYYQVTDHAKEQSINFEKKNQELLEKQDYEIKVATLTERNRIARDIHDNVGHLLSRCLLQTGALQVINKDEFVGENLKLIKETLSEAMDSIRSSVHNLHDDSIDLEVEIQQLIQNFELCDIVFEYDVTQLPDKQINYAIITIIKEGLSNIIKHSDATEVSILLCEHPALYQLVIKDNGSSVKYDSNSGIGLKNITNRVNGLGGNLNINTDKGFRIFISIPKEQKGAGS